MSKSTHQLEVKGVDKTAGAFASISARAKAASAKMRSMLGGAFAAAGAYLGTRAITGTISELGRLSDLAMKSGMSVEELTKASTAFQVAGLNISVDSLTKSMQYLNKTTGRNGMSGFFQTVSEIAAIEDHSQRGAELVRLFGRSGLELQPLVNSGAEAVKNFNDLISVMPGVSTAAANAGDDVADAMKFGSDGAKSLWYKAVGKICKLWADDFPGGVRAGMLNAINYIEYFLKKALNRMTNWGAKVGLVFDAIWNFSANGYSWDQAMSELDRNLEALDTSSQKELDAIDRSRKEYIQKLMSMDVDAAANGLNNNGNSGSGGGALRTLADASVKMTKVANELVMGDSNDARKLATFGPQLQSETKKQTDLLEKIAENTEGTKDAVEDNERVGTWDGN